MSKQEAIVDKAMGKRPLTQHPFENSDVFCKKIKVEKMEFYDYETRNNFLAMARKNEELSKDVEVAKVVAESALKKAEDSNKRAKKALDGWMKALDSSKKTEEDSKKRAEKAKKAMKDMKGVMEEFCVNAIVGMRDVMDEVDEIDMSSEDISRAFRVYCSSSAKQIKDMLEFLWGKRW